MRRTSSIALRRVCSGSYTATVVPWGALSIIRGFRGVWQILNREAAVLHSADSLTECVALLDAVATHRPLPAAADWMARFTDDTAVVYVRAWQMAADERATTHAA